MTTISPRRGLRTRTRGIRREGVYQVHVPVAGKAAIPTKQGFCDIGLVYNIRVGWLSAPREVQGDTALGPLWTNDGFRAHMADRTCFSNPKVPSISRRHRPRPACLTAAKPVTIGRRTAGRFASS